MSASFRNVLRSDIFCPLSCHMTTAKRRHTKCGNTRHSASRAKGGSTRKLWIESGREQKWSSRFSSRLIVPRLGRESHIRGSAGQRLWRFAFLRDREGLVSSPPKPVSEFAPTKLKQARGHADTARVRDPRGWMRTWQFFLEKVGTCARGSAARRPYSATGLSGRNSGDGENVQKQRHAVNPCFPEILKKYSLWKNPRNFRQFCLFRRLPARRDSLLQPGQLEKGGLARGF